MSLASLWLRFTRPQPHDCPERQRLADCVAELTHQPEPVQYVLIARVLQILDPEHRLAPAPPPPDPRAGLAGIMPTDPAAYEAPPPASGG